MKILLLLIFFPAFVFAQTSFTPQFKRKVPTDSLLGYSIPGITGANWIPDTAWLSHHNVAYFNRQHSGSGTVSDPISIKNDTLTDVNNVVLVNDSGNFHNTVGKMYWYKPAARFEVVQPIFLATTVYLGYTPDYTPGDSALYKHNGQVVAGPPGAGSASLASNGLSLSGDSIVMGGQFTQALTISNLRANQTFFIGDSTQTFGFGAQATADSSYTAYMQGGKGPIYSYFGASGGVAYFGANNNTAGFASEIDIDPLANRMVVLDQSSRGLIMGTDFSSFQMANDSAYQSRKSMRGYVLDSLASLLGTSSNAIISGGQMAFFQDTIVTVNAPPLVYRINNHTYIDSIGYQFVPAHLTDTTKFRYDVVYADTTGAISLQQGVESVTPVEPAIPPGTLRIGAVLITAHRNYINSLSVSQNIYNADGSQTGNRTDDLNGFILQFKGSHSGSDIYTKFFPSGDLMLGAASSQSDGNYAFQIINPGTTGYFQVGSFYIFGDGVPQNSTPISLNDSTVVVANTKWVLQQLRSFHFTTRNSISATAPLSYNSTTGVFTISQATTSTNGYVSSTDWNTFNGKLANANFITAETPSGSINSSNTSYTLANTPVTGTVKLYRNGLRQIVGTDYTISGTTITELHAPTTGDSLIADYTK